MKKIAAAFGLLLSLAACSGDLPPPAPMATKTLPAKIGLDVQAINLADRSEIQPSTSPYNDNHFTPTINDAIRQWATDRLQATGQTGQAIILIKDASLSAQALPKKDGIDKLFTRQQTLKYTGHAQVSIEANGHAGFATADANATRSVTLPEDPTDMEKQDAYYTLISGLMKDLSANLDAAIQNHMGSFITTAPVLGMAATPLETPPLQPLTVQPMATALPPIITNQTVTVTAVPPSPQVLSPTPMVVMPTVTAPPGAPTATVSVPALPPAPPTPAAVAPTVIPLSAK